jgi:hypothetical protein
MTVAVIVEESEICGLRVISAAELRRGGTRLLSCLTVSPTQLKAHIGHWLALARVAGTVIVVVDRKSPRAKPLYIHDGSVDPLDVAAIEQCMKAEPPQEDSE